MKKKSEEELQLQIDKFLGLCPFCKTQPVYIKGTNIITCKNTECNGLIKNKENIKTSYIRYLNKRGIEIAISLFENK